MSYTTFHDISQYQGDYNDDNPVIGIKMSGGDAGLYYDSRASINYQRAANAGKAIIGYHFAGGTDPIAEADFFIRGMSPLAENDVLCLDWEVANPDPVGWCLSFVNHIHDVTGVWPLIYMNTSTCTTHDWSPVLNNCGLWIADYRYSPDDTVPCNHPYIIHQYTSTPLDTDALFLDIPTLQQYGYHAGQPVPEPAPAPEPPTTNNPTPPPSPEIPEPTPTPSEPTPKPGQGTAKPTPVTTPVKSQDNWLVRFLRAIFADWWHKNG